MSRGPIPQEIFDQILLETDIVDVVSDYVQLSKAGKNFKGLCPFHGENTPSFVVSPDKGIFKCFGCGEGGNVISFVSQLESISYLQAIVKLARRSGLDLRELPELDDKPSERYYKNEYEVLQFVKGFYHYYLMHTKEGKEALAYLKSRSMTLETIEKFKIGLAPSQTDAAVKTLENNDYSLSIATEVGLLNEYKGKYYDRFKSRIMFPIADEFGKAVGFSGRAYLVGDDHLGKYMNSPETALFQKSQLIYHLYEAKMSIRRHNRVLLFEGFLDVISAVEAGFPESVATMGTALTEDQCRQLRRLTDQVILCYDGDKAGLAAANKAICLLQNQNFKVNVVEIPLEMDPDEFIKNHGKEAFSKLIEAAIPAIDYQYYFLKKQYNLEFVTHQEQFKQQTFQLIHTLKSFSLQQLLLNKLAQDIAVGEQSILQEFKNQKSQVYKNTNINNNKNENNKFQTKKSADTKYERSEKMLIHYMLKDRHVALKVEEKLNGYLNNSIRRNIALYILDYYATHETMNLQYFLNWIDEGLVNAITDIIYEYEHLPSLISDGLIEDLIGVVKKYVHQVRIDELKKQISETVSDNEKLKLLGKVNQLKQQIIR